MISCKKASRLASEQLERKLSLRERFLLRLHLAYCAGCRRMEKQFVFLRNATQGWINHND
jgi:hypothetical protein